MTELPEKQFGKERQDDRGWLQKHWIHWMISTCTEWLECIKSGHTNWPIFGCIKDSTQKFDSFLWVIFFRKQIQVFQHEVINCHELFSILSRDRCILLEDILESLAVRSMDTIMNILVTSHTIVSHDQKDRQQNKINSLRIHEISKSWSGGHKQIIRTSDWQ